MEKLYFELTPCEHPYANEPSSKADAWSIIAMKHLSLGKAHAIFEWQWDAFPVLEWFFTTKEAMLTENFPFNTIEGRCIAECRTKLYAYDSFLNEKEEDDYLLSLENYFSKHSFTLPGTPLPLFYIGLFKGKGDISFYNSTNELEYYSFNMPSFINDTEETINIFLMEWKKEYARDLGLERLATILK